jgi:hypothetical protein
LTSVRNITRDDLQPGEMFDSEIGDWTKLDAFVLESDDDGFTNTFFPVFVDVVIGFNCKAVPEAGKRLALTVGFPVAAPFAMPY